MYSDESYITEKFSPKLQFFMSYSKDLLMKRVEYFYQLPMFLQKICPAMLAATREVSSSNNNNKACPAAAIRCPNDRNVCRQAGR
jgi:hypothetical protein